MSDKLESGVGEGISSRDPNRDTLASREALDGNVPSTQACKAREDACAQNIYRYDIRVPPGERPRQQVPADCIDKGFPNP